MFYLHVVPVLALSLLFSHVITASSFNSPMMHIFCYLQESVLTCDVRDVQTDTSHILHVCLGLAHVCPMKLGLDQVSPLLRCLKRRKVVG